MADTVSRAGDPILARVKLAWWREQLEALDSGTPPAEPRLRAVANELLPRGITGVELGNLEPGWATLLNEEADPVLIADRGVRLFTLGARLIEGEDLRLADAGALYGIMSAARRGYEPYREQASPVWLRLRGYRMERKVRGVTALARLAARDLRLDAPFEAEGSAGRAKELIAHLWFGRIS